MRKIDFLPDLLIPLAFLVFITHSYWDDAYVKARYRPVNAIVTQTGISTVRQIESCGEDCDEEVTAFIPDVRYELTIGSTKYFGSKYRNSSRGKSREWAENIASGFKVGDEIIVYHDPDAPANSVISTEFEDSWTHLTFVIPFILLIASINAARRWYGLPVSGEDEEKPFYDGFKRLGT